MENLVIKGEHGEYFIPTINFDAKTGEMLIAGESYLEDTVKFYEPILQWIKDFSANTKNSIKLDIKLKYFNTSSSRSILDILYLLREFEEKGGKITINWFIKPIDVEMKEEIEDYMLDTDLKIEIVKDENF